MENMCTNLKGLGGCIESSEKIDGTFKEFLSIDEKFLYEIPKGVSYEVASLTEPLAGSLAAVKKIRGRNIVILGAGPMGLLQLIIASFLGKEASVVEPLDWRRSTAESLGAIRTYDPNDKIEERFDSCIASAGSAEEAEAVKLGLKLLKKRGTIVIFSGTWPEQTISIDPNYVHYNELSIVGSVGYNKSTFREAIDLLPYLNNELERIISHRLNLKDIELGFKIVENRKGLKVQLIP